MIIIQATNITTTTIQSANHVLLDFSAPIIGVYRLRNHRGRFGYWPPEMPFTRDELIDNAGDMDKGDLNNSDVKIEAEFDQDIEVVAAIPSPNPVGLFHPNSKSTTAHWPAISSTVDSWPWKSPVNSRRFSAASFPVWPFKTTGDFPAGQLGGSQQRFNMSGHANQMSIPGGSHHCFYVLSSSF